MYNFPFWIEAYHLADVDGLCGFDGEKMFIEIQTKDAIVGWLKTRPKRIVLDLSDISSIELKTDWFGGWFYRRLHFNMSSLANAAKIPGNEGNVFTLRFKRKYLKTVRALVADLEYEMSIKQLDAMNKVDQKYLES